MTIELRDVTMENYFDVLNLDVKEYQKQFIATNAISLAEAYVYTKNGDFVAPLAVYDKDAIIGFVMIAYDKKIGVSSRNYLLFRFMIDKNFQNQGYFKPIMDKVLDYVRTAPAGLGNKLWLSYEPENEQERTEKDRDKRPHSLGRIQAVPSTRIPCRQLYEHRTSIPSHQRGHLLSFQKQRRSAQGRSREIRHRLFAE